MATSSIYYLVEWFQRQEVHIAATPAPTNLAAAVIDDINSSRPVSNTYFSLRSRESRTELPAVEPS